MKISEDFMEEKIPPNANAECVGPSSELAGKSSGCDGCPNQSKCASGAGAGGEDPAISLVANRMSSVKHKLLVLSGYPLSNKI